MIVFFEVIIYTLAASYAFRYEDKIHILIMFALGYASGNFLGIMIDERLNKYNILVMVITQYNEWKLADKLREADYIITTTKGYGVSGNCKSELKIIVQKNRVQELKVKIKEYDENAYVIVLDVKDVNRMPVRK